MTTSRIGIMGSLRLSKRSWLWLTIPPWGTGFSPVNALLSRAYYTLWHAATVQKVPVITKVINLGEKAKSAHRSARYAIQNSV
jgi:hypothetical protein